MKRTKNMVYKNTEEATELLMYTVNDGRVWELMIRPVIKNLKRKYEKGIYNKDLATDAWYHVMTSTSKQYNKEFGYLFSVQERFTAAVDMEQEIFEEYILD